MNSFFAFAIVFIIIALGMLARTFGDIVFPIAFLLFFVAPALISYVYYNIKDWLFDRKFERRNK